MALNKDTLAGLSDPIFQDSGAKFQREQKFGSRLFVFAWAVEILAASLGLIIAIFVAYDAYSQSPLDAGNRELNAVMGALPFLLIAIIELTKIPLASGLYRVRNVGWKFLILVALIGLTTVTFETMFTGLERQMTNITAKVTDGKMSIQELENTNVDIRAEIQRFNDRDIAEETRAFSEQIDQIRSDTERRRSELADNHAEQLQVVTDRINRIDAEINTQLEALTAMLSAQVTTGEQLIEQQENELADMQARINQLREQLDTHDRIAELQARNEQITSEINETENWLTSNESDQISRGQSRIGVNNDGRYGPNTRRNFEIWRQQQQDLIDANNQQIDLIRNDLGSEIDRLIDDQENLRADLSGSRDNLREKQEQLTTLRRTALTNPDDPNLRALLENKESELAYQNQLRETQNTEQEDIGNQAQIEINRLIEQRAGLENAINSDRASIPELERDITVNEQRIRELESDMRRAARNNQVYRLAQKWNGHEDILDVTEEELTKVGLLWFGSIAAICATIGTVLALIANIMTDPDAFVEKQKSRKVRPIQRGFRRLFLAGRKKLLKRRDVIVKEKVVEVEKPVEIEKEVEKIVEVEKVVEVEKIVEKEVDKFVPEIIPIPIFVPSDADHEAEMSKAAKYYDAINKRIDDAVAKTNKK